MPNTWTGVTIDCLDPEQVSRFWSALLGRPCGPSEAGWVYLGERDDPQPRLVFQPVAEPNRGKVRIHLDVTVEDLTSAIAQVVALGGSDTGARHAYGQGTVAVVRDPEDHEFCLVEYRG
jgi:predicted enzyme related to lactoylglutathione lyase